MVFDRLFRSVLVFCSISILVSCSAKPTFQPILEQVRQKHKLPAMAALVIEDGKVVSNEAAGTTRIDGAVNVGETSKWHLGSLTKAITAVIIATVVDEGKLTWDTKVIDVFPELKDSIRPEFRDVTLHTLLAHRAGLQHSLSSKTNPLQLRATQGRLVERRLRYVMEVMQDTPVVKPTTAYAYSNVGYALAASMAERATGRSYEDLAFERLFNPLGMTSAGFGSQNYAGGESQPMPHVRQDSVLIPIDSGSLADNPDVMNSGGRLHMTLLDWSKFARFEMGEYDHLHILKPETRKQLLAPTAGWEYDWGWRISSPDWSGGTLLSHSGSNNMNFATVLLAPTKRFALIVASNAQGSANAVTEAIDQILPMYLKDAKPAKR